MTFSMRLTAVACAATLAATLTALPAFAKDGRDFAGYYKISNAADSGNQVELTLTLQLYNYGDADLKQATVAVRASAPSHEVLATFTPVETWSKGGDVILTQIITVPRDEYDRWTHGQPSITITYRDANQQEYIRTAQVSERSTISFQ